MFQKLGKFITKNRWYVIGAWVIVGALVVTLSPSLSSVTSNDQASFLPDKYESAQAQKIAKQAFPSNQGEPAIILIKRHDGGKLTAANQRQIMQITKQVNAAQIQHVGTAATSPQMLSKDHKIQLVMANITGDPQAQSTLDSVANLRDKLGQATSNTGLTYAVTGGTAISLDMQDSSIKTEKIVGAVTVLLILLLPALVFRSPFAGLLSLLSVGVVYTMSTSLLALTAKIFGFDVSGQLTSLLIVVLFGIGTDYILFLLFRYRERLRSGDHTRGAVSFALERASKAIFSAALVVAAAFAAMFTASLGFFSSLAPGLVICVLLMLIAALTLVPALLAVVGDKIFWPSKRWQRPQKAVTFSGRLGSLVANHPGKVTIVVLVVLAIFLTGLTQYKTTFDLISQLPSNTESAQAYKEMAGAFPAGQASPVYVYVKSDTPLTQQQLLPLVKTLSAADGVKTVVPVQTQTAQMEKTAYIQPPQMAQLSANHKVAMITLLLADDPNSNAAVDAVSGPIRTAAHSTKLNAEVVVGGQTATFADLQAATNRDMATIAPVAAIIIFVILAILVRSLIAPIYLLLSVGLGVFATLGATSFLFVGLGNNVGLIFMMPILLYLFVVAVGTDYNILMITRLREEIATEGNEHRRATQLAVEHTAPTLASAGIILAGTFASLMLAGLSLLTEMGFSVTFGIALGAFVISMFLIPAVSTLLGRYVWWPGHARKPSK